MRRCTLRACGSIYNSFAARMPNMSYLDLNASWHAWKFLEVRGGINNMLDKDPPLATYEITSGGAANTYSTYEALGRQLFLAFSMKFLRARRIRARQRPAAAIIAPPCALCTARRRRGYQLSVLYRDSLGEPCVWHLLHPCPYCSTTREARSHRDADQEFERE